mmetsp:Transcript_26739/g.40613  ORF Transcript_26739/g.40613 Transcript_26739/m.40613 type:complete len:287 (-) Transcript_26739:137-997(-)
MNLRIFSRLVTSCSDKRQLLSLISRLGDHPHGEINGVSITLPAHEHQKIGFSLEHIFHACDESSLKLMVELNPRTTWEAGRMLDSLSSQLSAAQRNNNINNVLELLMIRAPHLHDINSALSYIGEILPLTAQFLEEHPTVGRKYGRRNAHGNILDDHVIGACHRLPFSIPELAMVSDVFLPTRLALGVENVCHVSADDHSTNEVYDLETVVQNTDLLCLDNLNQHSVLWKEVWRAQLLDGAKETYVLVSDIMEDLEESKWKDLRTPLVRMKFHEFLKANIPEASHP